MNNSNKLDVFTLIFYFLIKRILRYKMLLDDLVKATSKRHVDYENLLIAKDIIDEVCFSS